MRRIRLAVGRERQRMSERKKGGSFTLGVATAAAAAARKRVYICFILSGKR